MEAKLRELLRQSSEDKLSEERQADRLNSLLPLINNAIQVRQVLCDNYD